MNDVITFDCGYCDKTEFLNVAAWRLHILERHPADAWVECPDCPAVRPVGDISTHMVIHHGWARSDAPSIALKARIVDKPEAAAQYDAKQAPARGSSVEDQVRTHPGPGSADVLEDDTADHPSADAGSTPASRSDLPPDSKEEPMAEAGHPCGEEGCDAVLATAQGRGSHRFRAHGLKGPNSSARGTTSAARGTSAQARRGEARRPKGGDKESRGGSSEQAATASAPEEKPDHAARVTLTVEQLLDLAQPGTLLVDITGRGVCVTFEI